MQLSVELTQAFRQTDDTFASLLNRVRSGDCSTDDFQLVRVAFAGVHAAHSGDCS